MNIILFEEVGDVECLPLSDPRAVHIRDVLKMGLGDKVYVGVIDGSRGHARIAAIGEGVMELKVEWEVDIPSLMPLTLLVGMPRPQSAKLILREGASMGWERIVFYTSEKGEKSYADASLWKGSEWRELLKLGAEQAFSTRLPEVECCASLREALGILNGVSGSRYALDLYESEASLAECRAEWPAVLCLGPERGFSARERDELRSHKYHFVHMGDRVLRVETASLVGSAVLFGVNDAYKLGWGQHSNP